MKHPSFASWWMYSLLGVALPVFAQPTPTPTPPPTETSGEIKQLSPFTVNTAADKGYASSNAMGGSRIAIPLTDVPTTVVILNEQLLRDRAAMDSPEALEFVSGVQRGSDSLPGQEIFSLRGFSITGVSMRDGLPDPFAAADNPFDESSAYERIEVIKGPAGTLYGAQSMGGIVNKVSKWPKFRSETRFELNTQSYDEFVRGMIDSTGPLTDKLAYRAVVSSRRGERYYDEKDAPNNFNNFTGALTYLLGRKADAGKVWARAQYFDYRLDRDNGWQFMTGYLDPLNPTFAPEVKNARIAVRPEANTVPEDDISKGEVYGFEGGFEKSFSQVLGGDWTFRLVGRYSRGEGDKNPSYSQGRPVPVDTTGAVVQYRNAAGVLTNGDNRFIAAGDPRVVDWRATLSLRAFDGYNEASGGFADLVGDLKTGPIAHKLVLSGSITEVTTERAFFFWNPSNAANTTAVAGSYSAVTGTPANVTAESIKATTAKQFNAFNGHNVSEGYAFAVQDNLSVWENRIIGVVGARHDDADITNDRFGSAASLAANRFVIDPSLRTKAISKADTYKYGLVGKPLRGLSVYAQHSETFTPITSLGPNGAKNPDQDGKSDEFGVKADLFGGRLVGTFSHFDMKLTNVLLSVTNPPELGGGFVLRPVGLQKTKGNEFDLAAEPLPGLNLLVAYSKLESRDENNRYFRGVPRDANYSVVARYAFATNSPLKGAYLGGSWKRSGSYAGDATNTFFLPAYDVVDGFVGYERDRWGVQVNVYNLGDTDAVVSTVSDQLALRALKTHARLSLRYRF